MCTRAAGRRSVLLGVALALALLACDGGAAEPVPRLLRFVAEAGPVRGQACYGLVLEDRDGVPARVLNLGARDRRLCAPLAAGPPPVARLRDALALADREAAGSDGDPRWIEALGPDALARRVLPPAPISRAQLDSGERVVIGAGLNYAEHREEVDAGDAALLLFPKPVPPTGAYVDVPLGVRVASDPPDPVWFLDYEAELGFVLLDDVDLSRPLPGPDALLASIAFFAANDLSDREPIFLDGTHGFARAKGHPGYLPTGPWLVRGDRLRPRTGDGGERDLLVQLRVDETDGTTAIRQVDRTSSMIRGPHSILRILAARYRAGERLCMPDADGRPRPLHDARGVVPAGSIVLTGTPGGVAVRAPGLVDRLWLFVTGGFSVDGARGRFIERSRDRAARLGYLEPGERVETRVEGLGTQRWRVVDTGERAPYGRHFRGPCPDGGPGSRAG